MSYGPHPALQRRAQMHRLRARVQCVIEDGKVKTVIDSTYPMDQAADAYAALKDGHAVGKIVVTMAQ
jgi:NADPH:quinone reductase-like Zn-dependent oxidoreductase